MDTPPRILVVDDDREIRSLLAENLRVAGFEVVTVADGRGMRKMLDAGGSPDLIILDINLPGEDGFSLCRELRTRSATPVIMLTARGDPIDRVVGLEIGADDYLAKPFEPRELEARIKSVLRRAQALPSNLQPLHARLGHFLGWCLDLERRQLTEPGGRVVMLSASEFRLLQIFLEYANRVLSRDQLLALSGGRPGESVDRYIDLQVSRLRRKLNDESNLIKTVRNEGYVFAAPVRFE